MEPDGITDEEVHAFLEGSGAENLKAHPAPNYMAVEVLPGTEIDALEDIPTDILDDVLSQHGGEQLAQMGESIVVQANKQKPKIIACRVVEIGPLPGGLDLGWGVDDTIYTRSDFGMDIGKYRFMMVDKVICYKKADED
jgi:hypothetical protein